MNYIEILPEEIIDHIFNLSDKQSRFCSKYVCSTWYRILYTVKLDDLDIALFNLDILNWINFFFNINPSFIDRKQKYLNEPRDYISYQKINRFKYNLFKIAIEDGNIDLFKWIDQCGYTSYLYSFYGELLNYASYLGRSDILKFLYRYNSSLFTSELEIHKYAALGAQFHIIEWYTCIQKPNIDKIIHVFENPQIFFGYVQISEHGDIKICQLPLPSVIFLTKENKDRTLDWLKSIKTSIKYQIDPKKYLSIK